jgi:hypothetical protein
MSIELNQANKRQVWDFWTSLEASDKFGNVLKIRPPV